MREALLLLVSLLCCVLGFAWLALAMEVHWKQALHPAKSSRGTQVRLRTLGALAIAGSLFLCIGIDHPSIAALVWIMLLAASSLIVSFTLSWKPGWLAVMVPWARVAR